MSAIEVEFEDLFGGRPDQLDTRAQELVVAAEAIERATESLRALIEGQTSASTDAIAETASEIARSLSRARLRYRKTGEALQTYAADLRPIQRDARTAVDTHDAWQAKTYALPTQISMCEADLLQAEAMDAAPWRIDQIEDDLWRLRQSQTTAIREIDDARSALNTARERLRVIADTAISAIETAIEYDRDSAADNWNQFWDDAAGWIGEWAASVLKGILEFLGELLAVLVAIVVIVLLVVLVVALLAMIPLTALLIVGAVAALIVASLLAVFAAREGRDPRHVAEASTSWTRRPADADRAEDASDFTPADYGDLIEDVGRQDRRGGDASTHVRVVAIRDDDGNVLAWRVQLPSTQNWSPFNEQGALNDLSADAMLALMPELRTQYERAAWDAMARAGVLDSDAPIMLTGWSLGGMMAGDIATDPALAGRVQSVVTAGSAIDKHAGQIDPSVRVTQINNRWDPVHTLEFVGYENDDVPGENWHTYRPTDIRIHDATMYGELADDAIAGVRPGDEVFFADDVSGTYEQIHEEVYVRG